MVSSRDRETYRIQVSISLNCVPKFCTFWYISVHRSPQSHCWPPVLYFYHLSRLLRSCSVVNKYRCTYTAGWTCHCNDSFARSYSFSNPRKVWFNSRSIVSNSSVVALTPMPEKFGSDIAPHAFKPNIKRVLLIFGLMIFRRHFDLNILFFW